MKEDPDLMKKTTMSAESIIDLFKICVQTTYFAFNKKLSQQIDGLAIGASTSGFAAELFMVKLETKALSTFTNPPSIWKRYVDDTFSKLKKIIVNSFLEHLNSQHQRIKFTTEVQENQQISFLDTLVHIKEDKTVKTTIYRKSTHTDQYLDFQSNHHVKQKMGIIGTFRHRINELITNEEDKMAEEAHVKKALKICGHPNWVLNRTKKRTVEKEKSEPYGKIVIPYVRCLSENLAKIYKRHNIETIHKPSSTIKNLICNKMKDKVEKLDKTGAVYYNYCKKHERSDYVGETDRVLRERLYEHRIIDHKTSTRSASIDHPGKEEPTTSHQRTGTRRSKRTKKRIDYKAMNEGSEQQLTEGNTEFSAHVATDSHRKEDLQYKILFTDDNWFKRGVKEAIAIRKVKPTLNKDGGRYHLSAIYDDLIRSRLNIKTPEQGETNATEEQ